MSSTDQAPWLDREGRDGFMTFRVTLQSPKLAQSLPPWTFSTTTSAGGQMGPGFQERNMQSRL